MSALGANIILLISMLLIESILTNLSFSPNKPSNELKRAIPLFLFPNTINGLLKIIDRSACHCYSILMKSILHNKTPLPRRVEA